MTDMAQVEDLRSRTVVDHDGEKISKVNEIYLDEATGRPEWVLVNTGFLGANSSFIPLAGAEATGEELRVPWQKSHVLEAPSLEEGRALSQEEEAQLYAHYGLDYSEERSDTGLPEGSPPQGGEEPAPPPAGDAAITRSEEEVAVGKTTREKGRVRLRKYVVTDEVQTTVPVQREEVRLEREPITDENVDQATQGPEISEDEHEVTLREEEVVVEKRTVPKERVRLDKETVTDEQEVSEEVRKEQIDIERDR